MLVVAGKRFNREWLASIPLSRALFVCSDTPTTVVTDAWHKANGITAQPPKDKLKTK